MVDWKSALDWLLEHGHDIVYQTRRDGLRGHFVTLAYLKTPYMSMHESHEIEGADFEDCVIAAMDWAMTNTERV
jgi:hypothetical protein